VKDGAMRYELGRCAGCGWRYVERKDGKGRRRLLTPKCGCEWQLRAAGVETDVGVLATWDEEECL